MNRSGSRNSQFFFNGELLLSEWLPIDGMLPFGVEFDGLQAWGEARAFKVLSRGEGMRRCRRLPSVRKCKACGKGRLFRGLSCSLEKGSLKLPDGVGVRQGGYFSQLFLEPHWLPSEEGERASFLFPILCVPSRRRSVRATPSDPRRHSRRRERRTIDSGLA